MGIMQEFKEFLAEYKVVGLAVAFIMGMAVNDLVKSLVDNIIMPLIAPLLPAGEWKAAVIALGPFNIGIGPFIAALINFVIIALVIFLIVKMVLKEPAKK
ncbi:MAG: MscL family protein [Candidatus Micrarchaeia archaeon]